MYLLRYFFIFIVFSIVTIAGEYLIYISFHRAGILKYVWTERVLLGFGILFPLMFIGSMLYGGKHFSLLNSCFYTVGAAWLGMLIYVFVVAFIVSILIFINSYFGGTLPIRSITMILLACALCITGYGIYHANNPIVKKFDIKSEALAPLWKDKKIVFISDTHLGNVRREKFMKKVVDIINTEKPDIVFNLGDLIDGPSFPYEKGFAPLSELNPPLGNYYVEGNHESYSQEYSLFKSKFPKSLNDITNKKVTVNNTQIIGIPYKLIENGDEIKDELIKVGYDKNTPSIILMHDPKDIPALAKNNVSLVLSGHTHAGQLFPITILLQMINGSYNHGVTYTSNTVSVTSSGVGTAMTPMRIGTDSEIVVLNIK